MKNKLFDEVVRVAEELGWTVDLEMENSVTFSQYSPAGQDFSFSINFDDIEDLINEVEQYYENYDASYEAYLWLDETGHGKNGAPYEMIDVYNDMEACKDMVWELSEALGEIDISDFYEEDEEE